MKPLITIISIIMLLLETAPGASAQANKAYSPTNVVDSVSITFPPAKSDIDRTLDDNAAVLDGIHSRLTTVRNDSTYSVSHVTVIGASSPDGSLELNNQLSKQRAETLFKWFEQYNHLSDADKEFILLGRDWAGALRLASRDPNLPFKEETLSLLAKIASEKEALGGEEPANSLERIKALHSGVPYLYMYEHIFPALRKSKLIVDYRRILAPEIEAQRLTSVAEVVETAPADTVFVAETDTVIAIEQPAKKFYMDIRSNMLYDVAALPNIGIDFYLGKNFSIGANWMYGWWNSKKRFRYWRAYGGEVNARWWFGGAARRKPLTGHHLGVYGQIYTYDFQWGGKGEMGGEPGKNMWHRLFWAAGLDYGYSLPVARRINIDFSLGLGYTTGTYYKYKPIEGHNVWQSTHKRHYWGPTKLEIALVWLIGNGNCNEKKGGRK